MKISQKVALLLVGLLVSFADATPLDQQRGAGTLITLPLKRYQPQSRGLHFLIEAQQLANRALIRHARMSGQPEPSRELLEEKLMRRVSSVEGPDGLEKRFDRTAVKRAVVVADTPTAKNSLGLNIIAPDVAYTSSIQLGTPPRTFSVIMDTGSADFWVGSESCQSTQGGCGNHNFLGPQSSTSFSVTNRNFSIQYGLGSASGTVVQDNLEIAGFSLNNHTFGVADFESQDFAGDQNPFDGLMGLAISSGLSTQKTLTPVEALFKAGLIPSPVTSFKLSRTADGKNDGEVTFGGLDQTKFDSTTLVKLPNQSRNGFWQARVDKITVGGKTVLTNQTAVLDTGTTLSVLPVQDAATINKLIPGSVDVGQGFFSIPCQPPKTIISMTFGNRAFDMDPRDLVFRQANNCLSSIHGGQALGSKTYLLGANFLKNVYMSTDGTDLSISLAKPI